MVLQLWKTVLKILNVESSYDLAIPSYISKIRKVYVHIKPIHEC